MEKFIDFMESPLGLLELVADKTHLLSISFCNSDQGNINPNSITNLTRDQLNLYFKHELTSFTIPLNPDGSSFRLKVWDQLCIIPYGEVKSYKDIALEIGSLLSIRAVGTANGANPIPIIIPCHRVIGSDKKLVGYSGGLGRKKWLLEHEGAGLSGTLFDSAKYQQNFYTIKNH